VSGPAGYRIEPGISKFTARALAGGMLSAFGHSPTFAVRRFSEATFDGHGEGSLELRIESGSLDLLDDVPERDRREILRTMNDELLETARFPQISYRCPASGLSARSAGPGRFDVTLNGSLTLRGVTRQQPIVAHAVAGEETLRGYGEVAV
jgi:polyisoprenoid-binding protein YceI